MTDILPNEQATPALAQQVKARVKQEIEYAPKPDPADDWRLNSAKEGDGRDDCPNPSCGTRDVESDYQIAERSFRYCCTDCGNSWWRETADGHAHNLENGLGRYSEARQTTGARVGRFHSIPSRRFSANYERAFGHK